MDKDFKGYSRNIGASTFKDYDVKVSWYNSVADLPLDFGNGREIVISKINNLEARDLNLLKTLDHLIIVTVNDAKLSRHRSLSVPSALATTGKLFFEKYTLFSAGTWVILFSSGIWLTIALIGLYFLLSVQVPTKLV
jgi:hypothetical protein